MKRMEEIGRIRLNAPFFFISAGQGDARVNDRIQ